MGLSFLLLLLVEGGSETVGGAHPSPALRGPDIGMAPDKVLKDKTVLVVDDEQDVLDAIEQMLPLCIVDRASDYETALDRLLSYTYDIVVLDVMGVNGFELLKRSVNRGFPTVMLTAHALTPEALKKSIKLGAVSFLPKEKMAELETYLRDVVLEGGKPIWTKIFDRLGSFFDKRFGPGWKERDHFFEEFEDALKQTDGPDGTTRST